MTHSSSPSSLESLPVELIQEILLHLSISDLSRVCQVCSDLSTFGRDWNFWAEKAWREWQFPRDLFKSTPLTHPRDRYQQVKTYYIDIYASLDNIIGIASIRCHTVNGIDVNQPKDPRCLWHVDSPEDRHYQEQLVRHLISRQLDQLTPGTLPICFSPTFLEWLSERGCGDLIDPIFTRNGGDGSTFIYLDPMLIGSARGGYLNSVKEMVRRGATQLRQALNAAIYDNHVDVVKYLVSQGPVDIDHARAHAPIDTHQYLTEFMIPNGQIVLNNALSRASHCGHLEIVQYLVSQGATSLNDAATECAEMGHFDVLRWLIHRGATKLDRPLRAASAGGHLEIVQYLIAHGATDYESALQYAQEHKHDHVIAYLLSRQ
jgi:hypothetical protein